MFRFLGVSDYIIEGSHQKHKTVYSSRLSLEDAIILYDIYKPHNRKLYEFLGGAIKEWEEFYEQCRFVSGQSLSL